MNRNERQKEKALQRIKEREKLEQKAAVVIRHRKREKNRAKLLAKQQKKEKRQSFVVPKPVEGANLFPIVDDSGSLIRFSRTKREVLQQFPNILAPSPLIIIDVQG